jgi:hypothetical protein
LFFSYKKKKKRLNKPNIMKLQQAFIALKINKSI